MKSKYYTKQEFRFDEQASTYKKYYIVEKGEYGFQQGITWKDCNKAEIGVLLDDYNSVKNCFLANLQKHANHPYSYFSKRPYENEALKESRDKALAFASKELAINLWDSGQKPGYNQEQQFLLVSRETESDLSRSLWEIMFEDALFCELEESKEVKELLKKIEFNQRIEKEEQNCHRKHFLFGTFGVFTFLSTVASGALFPVIGWLAIPAAVGSLIIGSGLSYFQYKEFKKAEEKCKKRKLDLEVYYSAKNGDLGLEDEIVIQNEGVNDNMATIQPGGYKNNMYSNNDTSNIVSAPDYALVMDNDNQQENNQQTPGNVYY